MVHYITETHANAFGIAFALLMGLLLLAAPKRYAGLPIVALMCYMTMGTNLVVAGFNFTMLRVVLIFGWTRLIVRGELRSIKLNRIDWAVIAFVVSSIMHTLKGTISTAMTRTRDNTERRSGNRCRNRKKKPSTL